MNNVYINRRTGVVRVDYLEAAKSVPQPPWTHIPFRYFTGSPEVIRLAVTGVR